MKPNKRFASVAAAAIAVSGLAVVVAPSAQAYGPTSNSLNCKTLSTVNGAGGPWVTNHTFTLTDGPDANTTFETGEVANLSLSFVLGPPTGPVALNAGQLVPRAVVSISGTSAPASPNNLVTLSGPAYGAIAEYTPIPGATLTATIPATGAQALLAGTATATVDYYLFDDTVSNVETPCNTNANPSTGSPSWTSATVNNINPGPTTIVEGPVTVSAPPATITAPAAAGVGSSIQVTGSNFPATTAYTVEFLNASNAQVGTAATGTTTAAGSILANLTVVAGATQIRVSAGASSVSQPFTPSNDECQADPDLNGAPAGCALTQDLILSVTPGTLKQKAVTNACTPIAVATCNAANTGPLQINFGSVATGAASSNIGASLNTTQVTDARGVDSGWSLTAQMPGALTSSAGKVIKQTQLRLVSTACDKIDNIDPDGPFAPGTDSSADITCGPGNQVFGTQAGPTVTVTTVTLATRTAGAAQGAFASGGGFYGTTGQLELTVPAFQSTGSYTGTLVVTLA